MGIFSDIRVLDLSRVLAGPWATQILGDMGAEIIKIEHPQKGDETRHWGPPYVGDKEDGISAYFTSTNRNKKSLALDIASRQGQDIVRRLVKQCDIVIENFKIGGLKKYGLHYDSLRAENEALIYCSVTGFGQSGPLASRPGYDLMMQAMGGLMSITGESERSPMKVGVAVCDIFTGLYSTIAITSALRHRDKTGQGQFIDMALFNASLAILANQAANYLVGGKSPKPMGSAHPNIVPYQAFATQDGYMLVAVGNDAQFASLCECLQLTELANDPRYATNAARVKNRDKLIELLQTELQKQTTETWGRIFTEAAIPYSPINDIAAALNEPQAQYQNMIATLHHVRYGDIATTASPLRFGNEDSQVQYRHPPPVLGEHSGEILTEILNMPETEIRTLQEKGIIKN